MSSTSDGLKRLSSPKPDWSSRRCPLTRELQSARDFEAILSLMKAQAFPTPTASVSATRKQREGRSLRSDAAAELVQLAKPKRSDPSMIITVARGTSTADFDDRGRYQNSG